MNPPDLYPEHLGDCMECSKPVMYAPDMMSDDPMYPMYVFDQESHEDVLYHWGCFDPPHAIGRKP